VNRRPQGSIDTDRQATGISSRKGSARASPVCVFSATLHLMSYTALGRSLREARRSQGVTQAGLAAKSGTSRVTIARLETGRDRDVRLGTITAVCKGLGLEMTLAVRGATDAALTRLERERERSRRIDLRRRHAALAVRLLELPRSKARGLVKRAQGVVDRWQSDRTCSHHYIKRWHSRLEGGVAAAARALVEDGDWTDALLQNSPWAFALDPAAP